MCFQSREQIRWWRSLNPASNEEEPWKQYFLLVSIKSMHDPGPLKQVLFLLRLKQLGVSVNVSRHTWDGSKLMPPNAVWLSKTWE